MTITTEVLNNRNVRLCNLRTKIADLQAELNQVHKQLMSGAVSHEEFLRLTDHRNNLIVSIEQKEQELEQVTTEKRSNYERPKYNY